ncbi:MAG: tRNA uridine-5-carboxymethylaminomethyl(34) synthesis GTPase MnmE [Clostridiales bacterium]|nr:tRNA uridine-5-carboxymethylaminomethyl(34) synthesis GTPase MnmE [Clostridiales bacterium]
MSTIAAISTPNAAGGISVIRISGENSIDVATKLFKMKSKTVDAMEPNTCAYGKIYNGKVELDDGIVTVFKAPNSYTGENIVEISCHGGIYVTRQVLRAILENGAKPAEAGEFTKRAFLNGKLSLTQAEAVMDLISANSKQALNSAVNAREGKMFKLIKSVSDKLLKILGELAAWVDYPEEDLPEVEPEALKKSISDSINVMEKILKNYDCGKIFREGIDTAIIGKANVGKSTLMNNLLGFDRSIVTDIAGTTRDIIEETARVGDLVLRLSDTAGIRETKDVVETQGINLARKKAETAQLVIAVFDSSEELDKQDMELLDIISDKKAIIILNKSDLEPKVTRETFDKYSKYVCEISAKNDLKLEELSAMLNDYFSLTDFDSNTDAFANERQKFCAENALKYLRESLTTVESCATFDCVTVTLETALDSLLELTGERVSEAVVAEVFSKFCVGK